MYSEKVLFFNARSDVPGSIVATTDYYGCTPHGSCESGVYGTGWLKRYAMVGSNVDFDVWHMYFLGSARDGQKSIRKQGLRALIIPKTCRGSLSPVSKPIFAKTLSISQNFLRVTRFRHFLYRSKSEHLRTFAPSCKLW